MKPVVNRRLGRRIALRVGLAMAAAAIGGLLVLLAVTSRAQTETEQRLARVIAEMIAVSFQSFDARLGQHPIGDIAAKVSDQEEVHAFEVFDHAGRIRWSADPRRAGTRVEPGILAAIRTSSVTHADARARALEEGKTGIVVPLRRTSSCLPCHASGPDPIGGVHMEPSHHKLLGGAENVPARAVLFVIASVVLLAVLLLALINRAVTSRVSDLVTVMSRAEEGDFMVRAKVSSDDEIALLASTFNEMLAKITDLRVERIDKEREMLAVRDELSLKQELARKSEQLEAANQQLSGRLNQLALLYNLGRELASELDLEALLDRFAQLVSDRLGVAELAVILADRAKGTLQVAEARGFRGDGDLVLEPFDLGVGVTGEAARSKAAVWIPSLAADPRELPYRRARGAGSVLVVPIVYQDALSGLLVFSSPMVDAFRAEDRELLVAVGNQAALALANAQLFQRTLALSNTDGLTGILNRRAMEARLDLEWSRASRDRAPLSVVMIDIDHFKHYNDQHGHPQGDETIRRVARILERSLRKVDAAARYGGEEFVVILPRAGKAEALEVAQKLRRTVEQADFALGYMQPLGRVTISCGVATAPEDAASVAALVAAADAALFGAKQAGRNQVVGAPGAAAPAALPSSA